MRSSMDCRGYCANCILAIAYHIELDVCAIFRIPESGMASLKPQDVLILLKTHALQKPFPTYAHLAFDLDMGEGEVYRGIQRVTEARLFDSERRKPLTENLREFVLYGVPYVYPARRGEPTRGLPTSYAASPLAEMIVFDADSIPVWPDAEGSTRGYALEPLYRSVPVAARRDPELYELLALVDALREGRARERALAKDELSRRLSLPHVR